MKRRTWSIGLALLLVGVLAVCLMPSVFAAENDLMEITTATAATVSNTQEFSYSGTKTITIPINYSIFMLEDNTVNPIAPANASAAKTAIDAAISTSKFTFVGGGSDLTTDFDCVFSAVNDTLNLVLTVKSARESTLFAATADTPKSYSVQFNFNDGVTTHSSTAFTFDANFKAQTSVVNGLQSYTSTRSPLSLASTSSGSYQGSLNTGMFTFTSDTPASLTYAAIAARGVDVKTDAASTARGISAALDANATTYTVSVPSGLAAGLYTVTISVHYSGSSTPIHTIDLTITAESYVSGFTSATPTPNPNTSAHTIASNGYYDIPLTSGMFEELPVGGTNPGVTLAKLIDAFNLTVPSGFTAAFSGTDASPVIRVTANSSLVTSGSTYPVVVSATYKHNTTTHPSSPITFATFPSQAITIQNPGTRIENIKSTSRLGFVNTGSVQSSYMRHNSASGNMTAASNIEVKRGDYIDIMVTSDFFDWDGANPSPARMVSRSELSTAGVSLKTTYGSNKDVIESAKIEYSTMTINGVTTTDAAYIRVRFAKAIGTGDKNFSVTLLLSKSGKADQTGTGVTISGKSIADLLYINSNGEYVDLSSGEVAIAEDRSHSNVEFYLGEGVTLYTDIPRNTRVSGVATTEPDSDDDKVFDKYSDIEEVYNLETYGLNRSGAKVTIDTGGTRYYVYKPSSEGSTTLTYLGTTNDRLDYSTKYYLSRTQLSGISSSSSSGSSGSSDASSGSSPGIEQPSTTPSGTTPGGIYPSNSNYNPINGR